MAGEVGEVGPDCRLPSEMGRSVRPLPEMLPQLSFGICRLPAETARDRRSLVGAFSAHRAPHPQPLPAAARGEGSAPVVQKSIHDYAAPPPSVASPASPHASANSRTRTP